MKTELNPEKAFIFRFTRKIKQVALRICKDIVESILPKQKTIPKKDFLDVILQDIISENESRIFGSSPYSYLHSDFEKNISALFIYQNSSIKEAVWDFKYKLGAQTLAYFAHVMADELIAHISDHLNIGQFSKPVLLLYAPSSAYSSRKRPWDQMKELCILIEERMNKNNSFLTICLDAIQTTEGPSSVHEAQHSGSKKERLAWSKERYRLSPNFVTYISELKSEFKNIDAAPSSIHIICIDDIVTTGATFSALKQVITPVGFNEIDCFALCYTKKLNETSDKKTA